VAEPSAEIVRRAQQGDPQALTEIILGQQHYIYSIAMSVFHHPEDAADLTQEACIRLCRALGLYTGESRFTTWLYRIVVNLCRDELRRRGRQVPIISGDGGEDDETDPLGNVADDGSWGNPSRSLDERELSRELRLALEQLETPYRLALTLYYFDELKYTDIAEILELPLNTVKSHIRRGKERLAQILNGMEERAALPAAEHQEDQPRARGMAIALLGR
jgi:RNA polymerase sigma-70 factor, ECF subfamily